MVGNVTVVRLKHQSGPIEIQSPYFLPRGRETIRKKPTLNFNSILLSLSYAGLAILCQLRPFLSHPYAQLQIREWLGRYLIESARKSSSHMIGTKLAHYKITSHLGSGGMGDVYEATGSKLGRSVAIKFLPEPFSHDTNVLRDSSARPAYWRR